MQLLRHTYKGSSLICCIRHAKVSLTFRDRRPILYNVSFNCEDLLVLGATPQNLGPPAGSQHISSYTSNLRNFSSTGNKKTRDVIVERGPFNMTLSSWHSKFHGVWRWHWSGWRLHLRVKSAVSLTTSRFRSSWSNCALCRRTSQRLRVNDPGKCSLLWPLNGHSKQKRKECIWKIEYRSKNHNAVEEIMWFVPQTFSVNVK